MKKLLILIFSLTLINQIFAQSYYYGNQELEFKKTYKVDIWKDLKKNNQNYQLDVKINIEHLGEVNATLSPTKLLMEDDISFNDNGIKMKINIQTELNQWYGKVQNGKIIRLNIYDNCINGFLETDSSDIFFETNFNNKETFCYFSKDRIEKNKFGCNVSHSENNLIKSDKRSIEDSLVDFSCGIIKLNTVINHGLYKKRNYDSSVVVNEILDIINISDGIYARDFNVRIKVTNISISKDSLSVYNNSKSTLDRIENFKFKQNIFKGNFEPDIYHLFYENYNPTDGAVGRGYLGGLCNRFHNNNTSVSMEYGNLSGRIYLLTHEIGHNVNLNHSDGIQCGTKDATIMCDGDYNVNKIKFFYNEQIVAIPFMTKQKKQNPGCLDYIIPSYDIEIATCHLDSIVLNLKSSKILTSSYYFENKFIYELKKDTSFWTNKKGQHSIVYSTDTLENLSCNFENKILFPEKNYIVTNTNSTGPGSLSRAIYNANLCQGVDTIKFAIKSTNKEIEIDTILPPIIESCVIDGTSEHNYQFPNNLGYKPLIALINKLPFVSGVYNNAFELSRNQYSIKGIEFKDFDEAISYNAGYYYKPENANWNQYNKDTFYNSEYTFLSNVFSNCSTGIYLRMGDYYSLKGTEKIKVGDNTLKGANFFNSNINHGIRIAYSDSSYIYRNYFGLMPNSEIPTPNFTGIFLNGTFNNKIENNFFIKNTIGITSYWSKIDVYSNYWGYNPFKEKIEGFEGIALQLNSYNSQNNDVSNIGGINQNQRNFIYNQKGLTTTNKKYYNASIYAIASQNTKIINNVVVNCDTNAIIHVNDNNNSVNLITDFHLDSFVTDFQTNQSKIYGFLKPKVMKDTVEFYFYSTPESVKQNKAPAHRLVGIKTLITTDTIKQFFNFSFDNLLLNEGITANLFTYNNKTTSTNSNVIYNNKFVLSTNKISEMNQTYYPNPVNNKLYVNESISKYRIINIEGKEIVNIANYSNENYINLDFISAGVYFIFINENLVPFKIIKN
ncbi:MAG: zinc-dependent metalloprotease family protein [Bacteroidota bacterium]|nr:zinc-dependent metalloprotease family protein [Bacteroidota bacterium]